MKNQLSGLLIILSLLLTACSKSDMSSRSMSATSDSEGGGEGNGKKEKAGVITAGEWNDLDRWAYWEEIIKTPDYKSMPLRWKIYNNHRISVNIAGSNSLPVVDAVVKLKRDGAVIFNARTDNKGNAELWAELLLNTPEIDYSRLSIDINNGAHIISNVKPFKDGVNKIVIDPTSTDNKIEIAFVVDATGSMGDEITFLKTELLDVIIRAKQDNPSATLLTSSVFYRDEGDDYLTRVSGFSTDAGTTLAFINKQNSGGGGDFPEAVHSAMDKAVNELQWSANAKTRLLFLVLDAPPHENADVVSQLHASTLKAAEKGIKIIPITASGIDKETEFLMRFLSITTNGTYVFITDDSGIGNKHLEPTVGPHEVEFLNDLMVRLIKKYAE